MGFLAITRPWAFVVRNMEASLCLTCVHPRPTMAAAGQASRLGTSSSSGFHHFPHTAGHWGPWTCIPQGAAIPTSPFLISAKQFCACQAQMQPRFLGGGGSPQSSSFAFPRAGCSAYITTNEAIKASLGFSASPGSSLPRASRLMRSSPEVVLHCTKNVGPGTGPRLVT